MTDCERQTKAKMRCVEMISGNNTVDMTLVERILEHLLTEEYGNPERSALIAATIRATERISRIRDLRCVHVFARGFAECSENGGRL